MNDLSIEIIALADYVSVSKENKLTIAGIFDRFFVEKVPTNWPNMAFVAVIRGNPTSQHKLSVKVSAKGKDIEEQELPAIDVKIGPNGKANFVTNLQNFPLLAYGEYQIGLFEGKNEVGKVEFSVTKPEKGTNGHTAK